jgi:hypothetical protein
MRSSGRMHNITNVKSTRTWHTKEGEIIMTLPNLQDRTTVREMGTVPE